MIKAGDYYATVYPFKHGYFQVKGEGVVETNLVLLHLKNKVDEGEVQVEIEKRGLRPAKIEELLAFGATYYHEVQSYWTVVALGSGFYEDRIIHRPVLENQFPCRRLETNVSSFKDPFSGEDMLLKFDFNL